MQKDTFKLNLHGKELVITIKKLAERANGESLIQYGQTVVFVTSVMSEQDKEGMDFFPLTVDYEERYYAAGKIFGSRYIKREGRPSEEAVLTARLIDRAVRPCFPEGLKREVQIIATCLSWDGENDPDILGLLGASISLINSDIPWQGPLAAARVARINDEFILNPSYEQRNKADLDLVLSCLEKDGQFLINMLEAKASEIPEEIILAAQKWAQPFLKELLSLQKQIIKEVRLEKIPLTEERRDVELEKEIKKFLGKELENLLFASKTLRGQGDEELNKLRKSLFNFIEEKYPGTGKQVLAKNFFEKEIVRLLQDNILKKGLRPDNRKLDEIREITCQVGVLPRTHGSALFCRGQTKALSILTLGAPGDQQLLEGMEIVGKKRFMHHYNFPPYSVGETRQLRGPGRRDIGHGMLVEKALLPLIPEFERFPYTLRIVSEMLCSNGSTSMASVSSSSLALMDAGVPLKRPAAGIAIGLAQADNGDYKLLTDIQGPEDHYGHMDFKIAGTRNGVTALQMDVKVAGIDEKLLKEALARGRKARETILDKMEQILAEPRPQLSVYAPRILTLQIPQAKIGEVVGPGGRIIKEIIEKCQVEIDIQPDGLVFITSDADESAKKALTWIKDITRVIKLGETFQGKIKRILEIGLMVELCPNQEGLVRFPKFHLGNRDKRVGQSFTVGQIVPVRVISIDEQGRINLSLNKISS